MPLEPKNDQLVVIPGLNRTSDAFPNQASSHHFRNVLYQMPTDSSSRGLPGAGIGETLMQIGNQVAAKQDAESAFAIRITSSLEFAET